MNGIATQFQRVRENLEAQSKITSHFASNVFLGLLRLLVSPDSPRMKHKGPTGEKPVGPKKILVKVAAKAESAGRMSNVFYCAASVPMPTHRLSRWPC
jgi:hypothetical protein